MEDACDTCKYVANEMINHYSASQLQHQTVHLSQQSVTSYKPDGHSENITIQKNANHIHSSNHPSSLIHPEELLWAGIGDALQKK